MKKLFNTIRSKARAISDSIRSKAQTLMCNVVSKVQVVLFRRSGLLADCRGDLATNTIGGIIVCVVIIGLLVVAVNAFFPGFFTEMFESMKTKLNANW